jgi:hypothetical protein
LERTDTKIAQADACPEMLTSFRTPCTSGKSPPENRSFGILGIIAIILQDDIDSLMNQGLVL